MLRLIFSKKKTAKTILLLFILIFNISADAQELYVGINYHPHDSDKEQWVKDIKLMKAAGFKVVRMGHLAWDSFEPTEGNFDFIWFDEVMDMMDNARIKVILDLAVRPAPIWLQHKFPSISITDAAGNLLYPNHRYMEDVGDPNYQQYALRFADAVTKRYAKHPALLAFGLDNESGDGPISYSETVRLRFIEWLKIKYTNTKNINKAWAGQRWSRKIGQFDEIGLPQSGDIAGAPERALDFRRFISDEVNSFLFKLAEKVRTNAPNALTTTNEWYYSDKKYFDYAKFAYSGKMDRGGCGYYPGSSLLTNWGNMNASFGIERIQFENTTPFWCTEFTSMTAVPGSIRRSAYETLLYGNQMICGWTWQSMHGGEEQYLEGLLDWDGITNRSYDEYKQIATEFKKIEKYFPYKLQADVALAFSFPSQIVSYVYPEKHDTQLQNWFNWFAYRNIDTRVIDITQSTLKYKLLIMPGVSVIDEKTANNVRKFVKNGGTVIMTGYSGIVDENNQVFASTHPGRLSDVFGIRTGHFEITESMNELSRESLTGDKIHIDYKGKNVFTETPRFDVIELNGAQPLAIITSLDKDYPIITSNNFGKGKAIYIGLSTKDELISPILEVLVNELSVKKGPEVPQNVMARYIDGKHILYINNSQDPVTIDLKQKSKSILFDKEYNNTFIIKPFQPEFIELK